MTEREFNFDGLVGPTHNYAGLSYGNVASMQHKSAKSSPKQAALEGLAKMKLLMDLGLPQAVLPPHERPHLPTLRKIGFTGHDAEILEKAHRSDPVLLASVSSASSMWAANAATVSPSADTADERVHFTPANLISNFHRSIEATTTTRVLRAIFADERHFVVHEPLPAAAQFADEGAANHMRLATSAGGLELFVYGRQLHDGSSASPVKFPARQTFQAAALIAQNHLLRCFKLLLQNGEAIDAGAFHNDVVAVSNGDLLLCHQNAYAAGEELPADSIRIRASDMPLDDAVKSYVFNSQLVTLPDGSMTLIAPAEVQDIATARAYVDRLVNEGAIAKVYYVNVRQSMHNGGGPACLRLRVPLTRDEQACLGGHVILTDALHAQLKQWIERHYRDELTPDDLRDPRLLEESRTALDALSTLLDLPCIHDFQLT